MATQGQVIENPVTGERFTFLEAARETNGERMEFSVRVRPQAQAAAAHRHPRQTETLTVVSGKLHVVGPGVDRELGPGESIEIPPGQAHSWSNETELEMRVAYTPALNTEEFFETFCALAQDGRTDENGVPRLLQLAVSVPHFDIWLAKPPMWFQRALFAVLGPLARLFGYRPVYTARAALVSATAQS